MKGTGKVKKHEIALFLNVGGTYVRIAKSKVLKLEFDPKIEVYDFIADESPTSELEKYAPKISGMPLAMYRDEKDFAAVWEYAYGLKTGGEAVTDCLLVYKFDEDSSTTGKFKAWKADCTVVVKSLDAVEGLVEFDLPFRGTVQKGFVTDSSGTPTFTEK